MASLNSDAIPRLKALMPYIGHLYLDETHRGTLEPFIAASKKRGNKKTTINHAIKELD